MLTFKDDHIKQHLTILVNQPLQVLIEFCKLALEFLRKGPNPKVYQSAANKLESTSEEIRNAVEGLVYLLVESCKQDVTETGFSQSVASLGFNDEQQQTLVSFYQAKKEEIQGALNSLSLNLPTYKNLDWRFDIVVASRSLLRQITPLMMIRLSLEESGSVKNITLQTDPVNLVHMTEVLDEALQEATSQHTRRVQRSFK